MHTVVHVYGFVLSRKNPKQGLPWPPAFFLINIVGTRYSQTTKYSFTMLGLFSKTISLKTYNKLKLPDFGKYVLREKYGNKYELYLLKYYYYLSYYIIIYIMLLYLLKYYNIIRLYYYYFIY